MARKIGVAAAVIVAVMALAVPAHAKGEGGIVTIDEYNGGGGGIPGGGMPGSGGTGGTGGSSVGLLAAPITLAGRQSAFWFGETGFGQTKTARPESFGNPLTRTELGPALRVTASFLCGGPGSRHAVHQFLYPYAKGGPQTYTPAGQMMCGMDLREGWWASPYGRMFHVLVAHGLPHTLPPAFQPAPVTAAGNGADGAQPVPDDGSRWPLILAAVAALAALVLSNAVVQRRRTGLAT